MIKRLLSKAAILAFGLLMAAAGTVPAAPAARVAYSASAYALEGDALLYVEKHVESWSEGRLAEREVVYEDPQGRLIARKLVRYGEAPAVPSFEMTDFRIGLEEGAEVGEGSVVLFSGPSDPGARRRSVERPAAAVVDAGFDDFMRENFAAVVAGEQVEFDFAVPALRRFFRFELQPQGEVTYDGARAFAVRMRPASALLRLLVDPLDLTYSPAGRLLEFRGLSNVCDENGDRYEARIVFDYTASEKVAAEKIAAP